MKAHSKSDVVGGFRRSQILEAARRSFARHGLKATTIDQIARAARIAKGTVYLYYRSKDDILRHTLDAGLAELQEETVPAIAAPAPFDRKLREFLRGMLDYYDRHRAFLELCQFELNTKMRQSARRKFGRVYAAQIRAWQAATARAVREGDIARVDPRQAALSIVSLGHGLALQRLRGWTDVPLDDHVTHATSLLWKGLSTR